MACGATDPSSTLGGRAQLGEVPEWPIGMVSKTIGLCPTRVRISPSPHMDDEVLVSVAVVFKTRAGRNSWLLVKSGSDEWQLPKGVVRRTESSVRAAIRMLSEFAGIRGRVIEEVGKTSTRSGHDGKSFTRRTIYYLMQQRGKDGVIASAKTAWVNPKKIRGKLKSATERKIIIQARHLLGEWQKQDLESH